MSTFNAPGMALRKAIYSADVTVFHILFNDPLVDQLEFTGPIFIQFSESVQIWMGMIKPTSFRNRSTDDFLCESAKIGIPHLHSVQWYSAIRMHTLLKHRHSNEHNYGLLIG